MSTSDTGNTIPSPKSEAELKAITTALGAIDHIEKTLDLLRGKITLREYHYASMITEALVRVTPYLHSGVVAMEMGKYTEEIEDL